MRPAGWQERIVSPFDPIKPIVRGLPAYTLAALETPIKLNQNENPFEIPSDLKEVVLRHALERPWGRYPDFVPDEFLALLAGHVGWVREGMLAGNGSNELIQAILSVTCAPGARVLIAQPTFTLYRLLSRVNGAEVIEVLLRREDFTFDLPAILAEIDRHEPTVVVLCSPNNPTGSTLGLDEWRQVCERAPGLVVADQAYVEFGGASAMPLLREFPRLVVLRTFSKAGTLAGLRVGYAACSPDIAAQVAKAKLPYNLNFFSMEAARVVIRNWERFVPAIKKITDERERVYTAMRTVPGVRVYPSAANFLLFETTKAAGEVFRGVYEQGVLIRDVSKYPLLGRALRVSIGTPEESAHFLMALRRTMERGTREVDHE